MRDGVKSRYEKRREGGEKMDENGLGMTRHCIVCSCVLDHAGERRDVRVSVRLKVEKNKGEIPRPKCDA
jgi:hypothetical protein